MIELLNKSLKPKNFAHLLTHTHIYTYKCTNTLTYIHSTETHTSTNFKKEKRTLGTLSKGLFTLPKQTVHLEFQLCLKNILYET